MVKNDRPQGKRALLVGINEYPNFAPERQLRGCLNDVALMRATLRDRFGFPEEGITVLTNGQAKRDAILAAMERLAEETETDDAAVFYYSGHGSQRSDPEKDEPDLKDETIIPFDSGRAPHENRDITDDQIYLWLRKLGKKTANITLWFDCCNSGSITRDLFGGASRGVPADLRPMVSPIPESEWELLKESTRGAGPSGWTPVGDRYVMIAACRDEQTANEYPPAHGTAEDFHGCLSYYLHRELMAAGPGTTYRDVFEPARRNVQAVYPDQTPQLEGNRDRSLFGLTDFVPERFLAVKDRQDGVATLDGGSAHAVRAGSRWEVYGPSAKQKGAAGDSLGLVEISSVGGLSSAAQIIREASPGAVAAGCRAFEVDPGFGDDSLAVSLPPPPAGLEGPHRQLADRLSRSRTIRVVGAGETSPVLVQVLLLKERDGVSEGDPVPQLPRVQAPTWAIVGGGDKLLAPQAAADDIELVAENLEKIARYRYLLGIRNPQSPLQSKVEATLLWKPPDGDWADAVPDAQGRIVFRAGDLLAFRVRHTHTDKLYLNVLDFGLTFKVSLMYPPAVGAAEVLPPLVRFEYGRREGQQMKLGLPREFQGDEGRETLKFLFATQPIDFSWMRQEGVRARSVTRSRGAEDWTTLEVDFIAVRK